MSLPPGGKVCARFARITRFARDSSPPLTLHFIASDSSPPPPPPRGVDRKIGYHGSVGLRITLRVLV